ncbi:MAG: hypothetical protein HQK97_11000 [Nitrospirae bacterium]|nr:hypothetical protein [Nitrospirota bacterium]
MDRKVTRAFLVALLITLLMVISGVTAYAEEEKAAAKDEPIPALGTAGPDHVTGSLALGTFNRYNFRGYELSSHSAVFQPSLTLNYQGFSVNAWGNIDTNEYATQSFVPNSPGEASFDEVDLKASYTRSWGVFSLTGGYIYYGVQYAKKTSEIFMAAAFDVITKPVLTVYRDIASYPGWYFNLALSHSIPLPMIMKDMTLDLGASVGAEVGTSGYWQTYESSWTTQFVPIRPFAPWVPVTTLSGDYTGRRYSAFHDGMLMAGITIPVVKDFTIQPIVMYTFPLSGDAKRLVDGTSYNPNGALDQNFIYGVNLTYNF